jgi:hypothetical protein
MATNQVNPAKAVLYTDGEAGDADHNLERAYEIHEKLQSNDPVERKAGDESISEAAADSKSEAEKKQAKSVIERND